MLKRLFSAKNIAGGNVPCLRHLQNLPSKFKLLNVFWTWSVSKGKTQLFDFFNWFSSLKNLVILNGFKNVQNMIQNN